jgi:hypothetical protein
MNPEDRNQNLAVVADYAEELGLDDVAEMLRGGGVWVANYDQGSLQWVKLGVSWSMPYAVTPSIKEDE